MIYNFILPGVHYKQILGTLHLIQLGIIVAHDLQ